MGSDGGARSVQEAPTGRLVVGHARSAPKHVAHVRDAGRVEAQRLVERRRALPSRKGGIGRGETRGREGCGEAAAAHAACRKAPTVETECRARAERTENIHPMSVTLDVSRLSDWLNADAPCRVKGEA